MQSKKVALVTGSSSGIGRSAAKALARAGYDIAVHYQNSEEKALAAVAEIEALGAKTCLLRGDMGDPDVPARLVSETAAALGRLDLLVSNAGFTKFEKLLDITVDMMDQLYRVDFRGMILMAQAAARYMVESGTRGVMLFNTSVRSFNAHESDGVYGALKAGMNRIVESFALDMAKYGIRVNGFSPGVINVRAPAPEDEKKHYFLSQTHRFIPLRRNGYANDLDGVIVFLASDAAAYITGQVIRVDGGLSVVGAPEGFEHIHEFFDVGDYLKE